MSLQTAHLGIMTEDQFKNRTKATTVVGGFASKFKSRGSDMAQIDFALSTWDRECNSAVSTPQKLSRVNDIAFECDQWNAAKSTKSTVLSNARRQVVQELKTSCELAYNYLKNKTKTKATAVGAAHGRGATKSLETAYSHERTQYLEQNKTTNPYSASAVEEATQDLHNMNYAQFKQNASAANVDRVDFMNREQRLKHLIVVQGGKFLESATTQVDHQSNGFLMCETYAVDSYGNFYSKRFDKNQTTRANHSSYCAGKEVMCAGTYGCINGDLVYLSNMSGHYRPNGGYLRQVLSLLAAEGVNMDPVCVAVMDLKSVYKATTFLQNGDGPDDWPNLDGTQTDVMHQGVKYRVINPA